MNKREEKAAEEYYGYLIKEYWDNKLYQLPAGNLSEKDLLKSEMRIAGARSLLSSIYEVSHCAGWVHRRLYDIEAKYKALGEESAKHKTEEREKKLSWIEAHKSGESIASISERTGEPIPYILASMVNLGYFVKE